MLIYFHIVLFHLSMLQFNIWICVPCHVMCASLCLTCSCCILVLYLHMCLRVMLEITCSCYFYSNLSVAFLVYSVVRSLLACLVCCFVCIWFVIQSTEHHPFVISSLPHALLLQPQQVSMHICCTTKIILCFAIDI